MPKQIKVALIGNPNTGKTSVFNRLTKLNQKVGNYPGITVEKKTGTCKLERGSKARIIDLPGTYSLNTSSLDESVVVELLMNRNDPDFPDVAVVVADVENLKRNLLLFTQIKDMRIPSILAINMSDQMERKGISLDIPALEKALDTRIVLISARKNQGLDALKERILKYELLSDQPLLDPMVIDKDYFGRLARVFPDQDLYKLWLVITQDVNFGDLERQGIEGNPDWNTKSQPDLKRLQHRETVKRYQLINDALNKSLHIDTSTATDLRSKLDRILIHRVWGYMIFFGILLLIFQSIYDWASYPMDWIDTAFAQMSDWTKANLPPGKLTDLLAEGIIAGLGGIVIFIPQIAILFLFISLLEESGYMSRVVFLMDRIMRRFGLSGKSVVPLISGTACAIPAVMAARNIEDWKERLLTILVVPFTTCSARLPVYLIIIALIIPDQRVLGGVFNLQGLTLMGLYLLGFATAILSAWALNRIVSVQRKSFFVMEMPRYKLPLARNVIYTVIEKTKSFVVDAGKIILAFSIVLWVLASYGPTGFETVEEDVRAAATSQNLSPDELDKKIASTRLERSYIGHVGKFIEPAVAPLGYDWKIGIAIVTSFAAREVFVGTLATIYSVGDDAEEETIKDRMRAEVNPILGTPVFNFASGVSLLLFYAFAMQCMSTLAIVKRETNTWKWPILQLVVMSAIAYVAALTAFQLLK